MATDLVFLTIAVMFGFPALWILGYVAAGLLIDKMPVTVVIVFYFSYWYIATAAYWIYDLTVKIIDRTFGRLFSK